MPVDDVERMRSGAFWQDIAPELMAPVPPGVVEVPLKALETAARELSTIGCTLVDAALPPAEVEAVRIGVEKVRARGLPEAYVFAYEAPWRLFGRLGMLLDALLGPGWLAMPRPVGWWVERGHAHAGWPAHRVKPEAVAEGGIPLALTAWVPLTRVVPANGCPYVVPMGLEFEKLNLKNIQNVRAMPAPPGSVVLWNHRVWTWGSTSSRRASAPSVSLQLDVQRPDVDAYDRPLIALNGDLPPLEQRLALVARHVVRSAPLTRVSAEQVALATSLAGDALSAG